MNYWREVVHISEQTGPQGGECWVLLLECGHHAFRPRPRLGKNNRWMQKLSFAPHKCKCNICQIQNERNKL